MELAQFNRRVGRAAMHGTEYENCLHFFFGMEMKDHEQPILFSPELKPRALLTFERKVPEFHLLAAVLHGRILSRAQVILAVAGAWLNSATSDVLR